MARKKKQIPSREQQFRWQEEYTRRQFRREDPAEDKWLAAHDRYIELLDKEEKAKKQKKQHILQQGGVDTKQETVKQQKEQKQAKQQEGVAQPTQPHSIHMPWDDKLLSPEQKSWEQFKNGGVVNYLKDHYKTGFVVDDTDQYDPQMASTPAGSTALKTAKPTLREIGYIDNGLLSDFYKFKAEREQQYDQYVQPYTTDTYQKEVDAARIPDGAPEWFRNELEAAKQDIYVARPADYGTAEWFKDAYTTHQIAMNEGQAQIFKGKKIRLQEFEDMRQAADDALIRQEKADAIEQLIKAKKRLNEASINVSDTYYSTLRADYDKAKERVAKIVGTAFNEDELEAGYRYYLRNHAVQDAQAVKTMEYLPLGSYYRKLTRQFHKGEGADRAGEYLPVRTSSENDHGDGGR